MSSVVIRKFSLSFLLIAIFILTGCGGSGGSSTALPSSPSDTSPPELRFLITTLNVVSGDTANVALIASDNVRITRGPSVICTGGASFEDEVFTAPVVSSDRVSVCTATAEDAAGNVGTASFTANILTLESAGRLFIDLNLSRSSVFEGAIFHVDSEETSLPSGTIEDFEIVQVAGPPAILFRKVNFYHFQMRAPSLDRDGDEILKFELRATERNGRVYKRGFDVTVKGRAGPGVPIADLDSPLTLRVGTGRSVRTESTRIDSNSTVLIGSRMIEGGENAGKTEMLALGNNYPRFSEIDYETTNYQTFSGVFDNFEAIRFDPFNFLISGIFGPNFAILSESQDKVTWVVGERDGQAEFPNPVEFKEADSFNIENPCYLREKTNSSQDFVWVGQREKGLSVVKLTEVRRESDGLTRSFDDELVTNVSDGRSLCMVFPTSLPDDVRNKFPEIDITYLTPVLTLDFETNEIVYLADTSSNGEYEEVLVLPLQTQTDKKLKIIDAYAVGIPSGLPNSFVVLLSDGQDNGTHRLIHAVLEFRESNDVRQTTYSWQGGQPLALLHGNFGGEAADNQFLEDAVVISATSNESYFFDNITDRSMDTASLPVFAEPVGFETLPGGESAAKLQHRDFGAIEDIAISYPETGEIRFFVPDPNIETFSPPID